MPKSMEASMEDALSEGQRLTLLGEIQWTQENPFYNTANGDIGPATLRTSSENFAVAIDP